jgi:hypothetical protein
MTSRNDARNSKRAAPQTSPALSDESRFEVAGQGRIKDAEKRFGECQFASISLEMLIYW